MINDLINYLKDKEILILGFGREGKSTYKFIRKYLPQKMLYIADKEEAFAEEEKQDSNIRCIYGENYLDDIEKYDLIIKSPGISFANMNIDTYKTKITSQLELFLEFFKNKTIGITGSKGKSTTSSLIYEVLKNQGKNVLLLGNIGIPVFDSIDDLESDTIVILEMSSHQLEFMKKSPHISILLNIYEEHLDHYKSIEEYAIAKLNIGRYQNKNDYFIFNSDNDLIQKYMNIDDFNSILYKVSFNGNVSNLDSNTFIKNNFIFIGDKKVYDTNNKRKIIGNHNLNNIMFVLTVCKILKLDMGKAAKTINEFKGLKNRMEYVGKYNDIEFYNDSIATIPEATINSVQALGKVNTLIFGGLDRGINYDNFIKFLNSGIVTNLICMPDTGYKIADNINNDNIKIFKVKDLKKAVSLAKKVTIKDKICLMSPAAASYGFFKNFEEKGEKFIEFVKDNNVKKKNLKKQK